MSELDGLAQWKCEHGHVLGFVERRKLDRYHVMVLLALRQAIDLQAESPIEPDVSMILDGGATVICSVCRETRYFSPSQAALDRMLARVAK
jgi:hypothetical protein